MTIKWIKIPGRAKSAQSTHKGAYKLLIMEIAQKEFPQPLKGELSAVILVVLKRAEGHEPDTDNVTKPIFDALKGVAYGDDGQISLHSVQRFYCGESAANTLQILPHGNALQYAVERDREECIFVGITYPRL